MSRRGRGRPEVKPTVSCLLWVMVELTRDRQTRVPRASVNAASKRLAAHLSECFIGGKVLRAETVRDHYKRFASITKDNPSAARVGAELLDDARRRRDAAGWDVSTWALVIDPEYLTALGYEIQSL